MKLTIHSGGYLFPNIRCSVIAEKSRWCLVGQYISQKIICILPFCIIEKVGESFYKLSELRPDSNYDHMCRVWYGSESASFTATLSCPCNVATANADARWRPDGVKYPDDGKTCFYERMPVETSAQVSSEDIESHGKDWV